MSFIRKKIVLFLLLITTVITPMEEQFLYNATAQGFCPALVDGTVPIETIPLSISQQVKDYGISLMCLGSCGAMKVIVPYSLEKLSAINVLSTMKEFYSGNCLFGIELISENFDEARVIASRNRDIKYLMFSIAFHVMNRFFGDPFFPYGSNKNLNNFSAFSKLLLPLSLAGRTMLLANEFHQKALVTFKNDERFSVKLKVNNAVDIAAVDNAECVICHDSEPDKEYINPCQQENHIFCKECLIMRFNAQKNKSTFQNKNSFLCDACCKQVPFDDEKFEIVIPPKPHVSLKLWAQQLGLDTVSLYFYAMVMCTLGVFYQLLV